MDINDKDHNVNDQYKVTTLEDAVNDQRETVN